MNNFSRSQKSFDDRRANEASEGFVQPSEQNYNSENEPIGCDNEGNGCRATDRRDCYRFEARSFTSSCEYLEKGICMNCFIRMDLGLHTEE